MPNLQYLVSVFITPKYNIFSGEPGVEEQLRDTMIPVLARIHSDVNKSNLINLPIYILSAIQLFASKFWVYITMWFN